MSKYSEAIREIEEFHAAQERRGFHSTKDEIYAAHHPDALVGQHGRIAYDGFLFEVVVTDVRRDGTTEHYMIRPVNGIGEHVVDSSRVHLLERSA